VIARETAHSAVVEFALDELRGAWSATDARNRSYLANRDERNDRMRRGDDPSWYGGLRSLAAAESLLTDGWREGAERLARTANKIAPPTARSRRRKPVWSHDGDDLGVDRALTGAWDTAWRSSRRVWSAGPSHVTVYANFGGNAARDADALFYSGAAALIVADRLEEAGYSVRLVASSNITSNSQADRRAMRADIVVKESEAPIQVDAIASVMCHAGIYRTFGFAAIAAVPGDIGENLGREGTFTAFRAQYEAAGEWPKGAVVLDSAYDRESCIESIKRALVNVESPEG